MCTCTDNEKCYGCSQRSIQRAAESEVNRAILAHSFEERDLLNKLLETCDALACEIDFRERMGRPSNNYPKVIQQYATTTARARRRIA